MSKEEVRAPRRLVLKWDYRLYGRPKAQMRPEGEQLMLVPKEIENCVVFLAHDTSEGRKMVGTAFFVGVPMQDYSMEAEHGYLVTARHVIDGIIGTGEERDARRPVHIRFNARGGQVGWHSVPAAEWILHPSAPRVSSPTGDNVDVAVLSWRNPMLTMDTRYIRTDMLVTDATIIEEGISVGCEVFLPSLFIRHVGRRKNVPALRTGHISVMPPERIRAEKIGMIDAYLAEIRSIGGTSGAPVFVSLPYHRFDENGEAVEAQGQRIYMLLGLMHGHWDLTSFDSDIITTGGATKQELNTGMAAITPASKIRETLMQKRLVKARAETEAEIAEQFGTTLDTAFAGLTKEEFEKVLRKVTRPTEQEPDDQPDEGS